MAIIGSFQKTKSGYAGTIKLLTIEAEVVLTRLTAEGEKTPDYRLTAGSYELGVGWVNKAKSGNEYVRVTIDDPMFPKTVFANLVKRDGSYDLLWSRPKAGRKQQADV